MRHSCAHDPDQSGAHESSHDCSGDTTRDATDGFNACVFCGFENFKRHAFCHLCGSQLPKLEEATAANGKKSAAKGTVREHAAAASVATLSVTTEVPASATLREKRARYVERLAGLWTAMG